MRRLRRFLRLSIQPLVRHRWLTALATSEVPPVAAKAALSRVVANSSPLQPLVAAQIEQEQPVTSHQHRPWWWTLPLWLYQTENWQLLLTNLARQPLLLLPVFNHAAALVQAMQALQQHHNGFEQLLLLDDGSTDPAVLLLLKQYKQRPGIQLIRHSKRAGVAACWQKGLQVAASRQQDLVLLCPELIVSAGWLLQLKLAAYSHAQIASVSANSQLRLGLPHWWSVKQRQQQQQNCARAFAQAGYAAVANTELPTIACVYLRYSAMALVQAEPNPVRAMDLADFLQSCARLGLQHLQSYKAIVWPGAGYPSHYRQFDRLKHFNEFTREPVATTKPEPMPDMAAIQQQLILQRLLLSVTSEPFVKPRKLLLAADSLLTAVDELLIQPTEQFEWWLCQYQGTTLRFAYCYPHPANCELTLTLDLLRLSTSGQIDASLLQHRLSRWLLQWSIEAIDTSLVCANPCPVLQLMVAQCRQIGQLLELEFD